MAKDRAAHNDAEIGEEISRQHVMPQPRTDVAYRFLRSRSSRFLDTSCPSPATWPVRLGLAIMTLPRDCGLGPPPAPPAPLPSWYECRSVAETGELKEWPPLA